MAPEERLWSHFAPGRAWYMPPQLPLHPIGDAHERMNPFCRTRRETDTFNDRQSQIAERKTGGGRGPGDHSKEGEAASTPPSE